MIQFSAFDKGKSGRFAANHPHGLFPYTVAARFAGKAVPCPGLPGNALRRHLEYQPRIDADRGL